MFSNRTYIVFNVSELNKVNFDAVLEDSQNSIRRSLDGTLTFVKWDGPTPAFVSTMTTIQGYYNYAQMLTVLSSTVWELSSNYQGV